MIPRTTEHQHCTTTLGTGSSRHARILLQAVQSCRRTRVILSLCSGVMSPTADADRASADRGARPSRRRPPPAPTTGQVAVPSRRPLRGQNARPASPAAAHQPHHPSVARSRPHALPLAGAASALALPVRAEQGTTGYVDGVVGWVPRRQHAHHQAPALAPCSATQLEWRPRADVRRDASATQQRRAPYPGGNWDWDLGTSKNERRSDQALLSPHHTGRGAGRRPHRVLLLSLPHADRPGARTATIARPTTCPFRRAACLPGWVPVPVSSLRDLMAMCVRAADADPPLGPWRRSAYGARRARAWFGDASWSAGTRIPR